MTEQTAPKEETAFISDNLNNFNRLAQTYTSLRDVEKVDGDQVNEVLSGHRRLKYYLEAADLVDGEGNIGKKLFLPIGQSRHLDDVLWEIKHPLLERIDRELYMFDEEETFVNSYEQALEEYKKVLEEGKKALDKRLEALKDDFSARGKLSKHSLSREIGEVDAELREIGAKIKVLKNPKKKGFLSRKKK